MGSSLRGWSRTVGKTLAMIHTVASLSERFGALAQEMLPGVRTFHVVDEGLLTVVLQKLTRSARVSPQTIKEPGV